MTKLLIALLALTQVLTVYGQVKTYTCSDLYQREISRKLNSRNGQENVLSPIALGGFIASIPLGVTPGFLVGLGAVAVAKNVRDVLGVKEERALALTEEGSRQFRTLVRKVNKKQISKEDEVLAIVQEGFSSGDFCATPKLASFKKIKEYVIQKLEEKKLVIDAVVEVEE